MRWSLVALTALAIAGGYAVSGVLGAESAQVAHGKYLVQFGGCTDCHTPGHLLGKPDMSRFLGGSDVGLEVPGLGVFVAPNLTPDKVTGPFGLDEKPAIFRMTILPPEKASQHD